MRKLKASYACVAVTALAVAVMLLLPQSRQEAPIAVQTAQVRLGSVERILALSGRVRYETEYAALAPAAGLVAEVYVSPGERVLAGQPLATTLTTLVKVVWRGDL